MDLPTGILSKHITRKGDLCIRNLHQTFLRSEVTFGEQKWLPHFRHLSPWHHFVRQ